MTGSESSCSLNTYRDGDSTTSMGSPLQCWTSLSMKKFFLKSTFPPVWGTAVAKGKGTLQQCYFSFRFGGDSLSCPSRQLGAGASRVVWESSSSQSPQPLQRFKIIPFLLDAFGVTDSQADPHPRVCPELHVPRGSRLPFPHCRLPPPSGTGPPAISLWRARCSSLFSPFRLTTGPQHQLLVAQHQPFSKQQVQARRPWAALQ